MLDHLGYPEWGQRVMRAIEAIVAEPRPRAPEPGPRSPDLGGAA